MKKILVLLFLVLNIVCYSQTGEIKPITAKPLQTPNNATFYFNPLDSIPGINMGSYGYANLITKKHIEKYYVPYKNAIKDVDLGSHSISANGQRIPLFNGACQIPTILDNGDGSLTVGNGEYHLSKTTEGRGTTNFEISGGVFTLTDNTTNYLVADYNNGTPILRVITNVLLINETTIVPIFTAYRSGNYLHTQHWDALGIALANKIHQSIVKTQRYRKEPGGLIISEIPNRYISLTAGRVWVGAVPVDVSSIITSSDNIYFYHHTGGNWTLTVGQQYNNTQFDNGTNLVTLTSNRYAVNWVFRGIESQKHLYVVLGTGDYTLTQAQEALIPSIPTVISSHAMLVGKIIVQKSASTATSVQSAFDVQFSSAGTTVHNDLTDRDVANTHPASSITNTPFGNIVETNIQDVVNKLDTSKWSKTEITPSDTTRWGSNSGGVFTPSNAYANKITVVSNPITITWPTNFSNNNYFLDINAYYEKIIDSKVVRIKNAVYDFTKTISGFSLKLDTIAGYVEFFAADTIVNNAIDNYLVKADSLTKYVTPTQLSDSLPTNTQILNAIKSLDGTGSGLDSDLLDGQHGSYYQPTSTAINTNNIGSQSVNYATNAGSVTNSQVIKFNTGTTEGTDLYTYNGGASKSINILPGTNVTFSAAAGSVTINASGGSASSSSALVKRTTTYSVTVGLNTISFASEEFDTNNYHDNTTNPERLTVSSDGYYELDMYGKLTFSGTTATVIVLNLYKNNILVKEFAYQADENFIIGDMSIGFSGVVINASTNDYFTVKIQSNVNSIAILKADGEQNYATFRIKKL